MSKRIHVRPGKTQSKMGFWVGIVFCLIGVFMAIPTFGLFGIFWTAIAVAITYTNYKNAFTDEGVDSHVIEIDENGDDIHVTKYPGYQSYSYTMTDNDNESQESAEERLKKLQSLYDQSLITAEEYEQKRKEILEEL